MSSEHVVQWVTKPKTSEVTGLTVRQIESRIQRGIWHRGVHCAVIDGTTMINLGAVDQLHEASAATTGSDVCAKKPAITKRSSVRVLV